MTDNIERRYGFCDLCVNYNETKDQTLRNTLQKIYAMGYNTVAINQIIDEKVFETDKKKKRVSQGELTNYIPHDPPYNDLAEEFKGKLNILKRVTFIFSDSAKTHTLAQSLILKKYDLYAVLPQSQSAFQFACSQLNADVITLNSSCSGLRLNRKLYSQAVERGVHFEIQYSDLVNTATRIAAFQYAHSFYTFGRSKNVVISSGATNAVQIRSPYDIINLGALLGLNETKARASIHWQCKHLILKAEGRRYDKAVFTIKFVPKNLSEEEEEHTRAKKIKL